MNRASEPIESPGLDPGLFSLKIIAMTQPISLSKARKARQRAEKKAQADRNAAFHGLTKAQKAVARSEEARRQHDLDGKKT
ncbi:hypothetical protein POI8812_02135 [Pontivivens insulae]|uniref:DUF4169 domain-containing protein n=2 Tax=Pontivivens insulae TaxID=1639689 RepID=A0A2R8AC58_9RHOB|nr:uncharacterized protein DUF4169 [Pontivivens insulae]SPF29814.1 hypothetical protein POI8812_02135 [Pontivivens insulae]